MCVCVCVCDDMNDFVTINLLINEMELSLI